MGKKLGVNIYLDEDMEEALCKKDVEDGSFCPFLILRGSSDEKMILIRCVEKKCRLWNPEKKECCFVNWK